MVSMSAGVNNGFVSEDESSGIAGGLGSAVDDAKLDGGVSSVVMPGCVEQAEDSKPVSSPEGRREAAN